MKQIRKKYHHKYTRLSSRKTERSPVLWTCESQSAQDIISMKNQDFCSHLACNVAGPHIVSTIGIFCLRISAQKFIVWFQKISIPHPQMVLLIRPPTPLEFLFQRGHVYPPHPPGISYFPFHGLNLPYLEIIDRVPLKINCSHLKTHFFK